MSLLAIRAWLVSVKQASLTTLSMQFDCDADLMRQLLLHWVRRGCVRCIKKKPACGSCTQCPAAVTEWYEWVEA